MRPLQEQASGNNKQGDLNINSTSAQNENTLNHRIIWLAEDNFANILTIGDYLESYRYQVIVAHDGLAAPTALAMAGDRERCFQAGADEYLSKPVSLKILKQTIESQLQNYRLK